MSARSVKRGNVFAPPALSANGEVFETLLRGKDFRLERIVSTGQATPAGEWYEQEQEEWVVLMSGSATLRFVGPEEVMELVPGDWVMIPARRRHRVERTDAGEPSVWLAVHFA